ncbi:hypothetical protein J6590_074992 [Homalodisca vitripennis]|nr:hypothetical protein J6590_074992 [Homalodisca vitripennis]
MSHLSAPETFCESKPIANLPQFSLQLHPRSVRSTWVHLYRIRQERIFKCLRGFENMSYFDFASAEWPVSKWISRVRISPVFQFIV